MQFIVRLTGYLTRWVEISNTEKSYEKLHDLFICDQFISACSKDLAIHIKEGSPPGLSELAKVARQYLIAHRKQLTTSAAVLPRVQLPSQRGQKEAPNLEVTARKFDQLQCYFCKEYGHKARDCNIQTASALNKGSKICFHCNKVGHEARVYNYSEAYRSTMV